MLVGDFTSVTGDRAPPGSGVNISVFHIASLLSIFQLLQMCSCCFSHPFNSLHEREGMWAIQSSLKRTAACVTLFHEGESHVFLNVKHFFSPLKSTYVSRSQRCRCRSLPGPHRPLNSMPSRAAREGFPVMSTSIALIVLWSKLDQHLLSSLRGVSPSCGS